MSTEFEIGIIGYTGRLGSGLMTAARARGWRITLQRNSTIDLLIGSPKVIFEAARPAATLHTIATAKKLGAAIVLATSGRDSSQEKLLLDAARHVPVIKATNLSRGHQLQLAITAMTASYANTCEWQVLDRHPATKLDSPSASAKALSLAAGGAPIQVLRTGDPVADHHVLLSWPGETLEIIHKVNSLAPSISGALNIIEAASKLLEPGLYEYEKLMGDFYEC